MSVVAWDWGWTPCYEAASFLDEKWDPQVSKVEFSLWRSLEDPRSCSVL